MLQLFYSNRYETLVQALVDDLAAMPADPWTSEQIVVPSAAVRRRLELELAARRGICANVDFDYLAQWLWKQIGGVIDVPQHSPLGAERLAWRCYRLFARSPQGADGALDDESAGSAAWLDSPRLRSYLEAADAPMRYELARRVATVFDHYLTYRPEWLARWQRGQSIFEAGPGGVAPSRVAKATAAAREDERWQAGLWRAVLAELAQANGTADATPPAHRFLELVRTLDLDAVMRARWPESVSVFALPTIAPLYIALLRELSRWIDVRLYVMNPCRQFWFDIVTEKTALALDAADSLDFHEVGHPLLAEWGRQTQAQLHLLHELTEGAASGEATRFAENEAPNWLARVQNAMLDLVPEGSGGDGDGDGGADADGYADAEDVTAELESARGIEVHACHSLSRQLEVLHDRLLGWFDDARATSGDALPGLRPSDVLVVCPDLAAAAPLIDAVFGTTQGDERGRIPYRITGLPPSQANPIARVLLDWLALADRGVTAPELVEWLRVDAVAVRYGIDAVALDTVQGWLAAAGARRGLANEAPAGGDERAAHALTGARHTFADALTRLFLGYAMPDDGEPVDAWLPVAGARGADAELLGRLARFVDDLYGFVRRSREALTCDAWSALLADALARLFDAAPPFADSLAGVRDAVEKALDAMRDGARDEQAPAAVVRAALTVALDDAAHGGVPWGGVTFSSLTSLRGLPYRAICLIGMDDGVLPSLARADEFDLMAAMPQLGDRQRRADERNLFLDLLLAARERFFIGYTGRSIRDNAPLPPASLVDELLDHLARAKAGADAAPAEIEAARASFVVEHPLQPFSAAYFNGTRPLFSYDAERARLARQLAANAEPVTAPFFAAPLPPEAAEPVSFADFQRFWQHPARALLRERLGVVLEKSQGELLEVEPFELDYAGRDALADRLLPRLIDRDDDESRARAWRIAQASPELPAGATGDVLKRRELGALGRLAGDVRTALAAGAARLPFALQVSARWPDTGGVALFGEHDAALREALLNAAPVQLQGTLSRVTDAGQVLYRYASPNAREYLNAWLAHLAYCAAQPDGPCRTVWYGATDRFAFSRVDEPLEHLALLVALFVAGRRLPLRFFPRSAWAKANGGDSEALGVWISDRVRGESDDPALTIAWRGLDLTLDEPFGALAGIVFEPLIAHLTGAEA
ncbi:exodeoxyribonuclease V subunit gamma [Trinickia dinghuensis]|uniref:RecBCD enzyme subunit RecC n=1 Tax=Trinickia dinghuensis TaxID=2291023 RepID=A0A3D8JX94_9BURK|nr:exodeoxyribonuclease V subunit gamma [Trinickia dinghuensis]RDU96981.1 exodeoxyribonuclease V subunit gamma [Trinickia dinghuensis]